MSHDLTNEDPAVGPSDEKLVECKKVLDDQDKPRVGVIIREKNPGKKVSGREWQRRAIELLNANVKMQGHLQEMSLAFAGVQRDMGEVCGIAEGEIGKLRMMVMPGAKDAWEKVLGICGQYRQTAEDDKASEELLGKAAGVALAFKREEKA